MSYTGQGVWYADPNTKIPADSHYFSMRISLATAGTSQTIALPDQNANPGQLVRTNPLLPNNQPQQGRRFFVTKLVVRDPAGVIAPAGTTGGGTVALIDQTQSNATVATLTSTPGASSPLVQIQTVASATVAIQPYDQLAIAFTQTTGATSTTTGFSVDVFGYWQQGV